MADIPNIPLTSHHRVEADGVNVFYREAGPAAAPVILLLHGFPTSSFQYRELIPRLADRYHVIAPDLPGFGFTEVPAERNYKYTFDGLAKTIFAFTNALKLADTPCMSSITAHPQRLGDRKQCRLSCSVAVFGSRANRSREIASQGLATPDIPAEQAVLYFSQLSATRSGRGLREGNEAGAPELSASLC
jgi:hypothetical protein